jgi:predicted PurR-regulated permease PerM
LLVIGVAIAAMLWLLGQLIVVVVAIAAAILLTRALVGPSRWLEDRGVPRGLAAAITLLSAILLLVALVGLVGLRVGSEMDELGATISQGVDDVETWLVEDSPFDIDRQGVAELRQEVESRISTIVRSSGDSLLSSAVLAVEFVSGFLLALIVAFFVVKDRDKIVRVALKTMPAERRPMLQALGSRAWLTLGGYLRGVGLLGVIEATVIGAAVWIVGGQLVVAVVVVTLVGAFVPIVGAVVAGVVAVLVTLATAGTTPALIVAVVAIVVQQLDNDLLAPVIYGKSLQLHPLVILLGIACGTALFGLVGALLAVPVISVGIGMLDEARSWSSEQSMDHDGRHDQFGRVPDV